MEDQKKKKKRREKRKKKKCSAQPLTPQVRNPPFRQLRQNPDNQQLNKRIDEMAITILIAPNRQQAIHLLQRLRLVPGREVEAPRRRPGKHPPERKGRSTPQREELGFRAGGSWRRWAGWGGSGEEGASEGAEGGWEGGGEL